MPSIDRRSVVVGVVGGLVVAAICGLQLHRFFTDLTFIPPVDFLEYWSAGRLNAAGANPYDPDELLRVQQEVGRTEDWAIIMWNPPWALALAMPFGLCPVRVGQLLWMLCQAVIAVVCADRVWKLYGGPGQYRPAAWIAAILAFPLMHIIFLGQAGGWVLLGMTGLLLATVTGRSSWAVLGVLAALKPHNALPLVIALLLNGCRTRRGAALLAWGATGLLGALAVAWLANPDVWGHYLASLTRPEDGKRVPLTHWAPPLLGYRLRMWFEPTAFWIQFVPACCAVVATVCYWWVRRATWDWRLEFPRLLIVGLILAPYGAWEHDQIVLLIPVMAAGATLARTGTRNQLLAAMIALAVINLCAYGIRRSENFIWVPPVLLLWYLVVMGLCRQAVGAAGPDRDPEADSRTGTTRVPEPVR